MRILILSFTILLFTLSGIITFKALSIPGPETVSESIPAKVSKTVSETIPETVTTKADEITDPKKVSPDVELLLGKFAEEQAVNRLMVEKLQATISTLEDKLTLKNEEPQPVVIAPEPKAQPRVLAVLGAGLFRSGQVIIDEELKNAVNEFILDILDSPDHRVVIEGHTDNIPIKASTGRRYKDNIELSFLRAKAVALILERNGIPLDRISITGYGDTRPIAPNDSEDGRIKNRRVEVKLIPDNKEL